MVVKADGTADSARPVKQPSFATTSFTFCALGALTRSEFPPSPTGAAVEVTIPVEFENR